MKKKAGEDLRYLESRENTGYGAGGANTRKENMKGFVARSGSAHTDIDEFNWRLRSNARVLYQISPVITSAIDTLNTDVVGCGLKPNPNVDYEYLNITSKQASELNAQIKRYWKIFSAQKECDATGLNNFYEIEELIFSSGKQSGDCFVLLKWNQRPFCHFGLKLHVLEADRISTPSNMRYYGSSQTQGLNTENNNTIYDGVEVDSSGEVVAYWISKYHPADVALSEQTWERVEPYDKNGRPNILHYMRTERPDQYRGVSYSAKIIESGIGIKRYDDSTQLSAYIGNCISYWLKKNSVEEPLLPEDTGASQEVKDRTDPDDILISPGSVNTLKDGEEVVQLSPNQPTTTFAAYMDAQYKIAGAATGQGGEKLMHSFNASYSASRAALEEAWKYVEKERAAFVNDICNVVYELFFAECVARGYVNAPGFFGDVLTREAYLRCSWVGQAKGSLDPVKETTAALMQMKEGIKTRQQITLELTGGDWEENVAMLKRENELLKEAGISNNGESIEYEETEESDKSNDEGKGTEDSRNFQNGGNRTITKVKIH